MTKFENIPSMVLYDTDVINTFYQEMGYGDNNHFHKVIWRPYMCNYFMESGPYVWFERVLEEDVENEFFALMNEFFDAYPEFNDGIKLIFNN